MKIISNTSVFYLDKTVPKGSIVVECGKLLQRNQYKIKILNTINFKNPVDLMFEELAKREPHHFAVRQYAKYRLAAGVVCSKRLLNQAVGKSLRTHNLKPKEGAQVMRKNEKITALYERLSRDDFGKDDDQQRESNSISNQELLCRGWFLPPNTYDCGSFVVNGTAVVGKEQNNPYNRCKSTQKGADSYEISI